MERDGLPALLGQLLTGGIGLAEPDEADGSLLFYIQTKQLLNL